jgi:uncharacterized membrane protein YhaH (DUF805 family)
MFTFIERLFSGRLSRRAYLVAQAYLIVIFGVLGVVASMLSSAEIPIVSAGAGILYTLVIVAFVVYQLAIDARRLHDIGYTGFVALLKLVPGANIILWIYLFVRSGDPKTNQYGELQTRAPLSNIFRGKGNPKPFVDQLTGARV